MLIYEALKKDHDKLKSLLDRLVASADADDASRSQLIDSIKDELVPHSRAEEAVFYNSLREIPETKSLVAHGYAEHVEAETLLLSLKGLNAVNLDFSKGATKLRESLLHHIEEEESEIFESAKQVLATEEASMMAEAFLQMKPQIEQEGVLKSTGHLIANIASSMPERFAHSLKGFLHKDD